MGINVAELIKKDKNCFGTIKNLNRDTYNKIMSELASGEPSDSSFDANVKMIGYLEGDLMPQGRVTGKIFVEISAEGVWEEQGYVGQIPIIVEISVEGSYNAIRFNIVKTIRTQAQPPLRS